MPTLVPAILTKAADEVEEKIRFLELIPEITVVQIDFEDGQFVENTTVLPHDLLGLETKLLIEAHLMVKNPQNFFHELELLHSQLVYVHYESFSRSHDLETALANAKALGLRCGVAINPHTEISVLDPLKGRLKWILLMSVHPGFQGQKFIPESLERLKALRSRHEDAIIEIDGGVNLDNFESVVAHGADRIVVGSGIWQTPDARETIHHFLKKLK